jgi:outer membrane protein assembly factor BamA
MYIQQLPGLMESRGFAAASIDSIYYDSTTATAHLYVGESFQLASLYAADADKKILEQAGWNEKSFAGKPLNADQLRNLREKVLDYLENNGYPFASLRLDSLAYNGNALWARLNIDKGPLYKIDSIRIYGKASISNVFLQRYLEINKGSIYRKNKLQDISKKLLELPFLTEDQSWNLTLLGTGSVLNLYLQPKKSSQVNVLVGFLPASEQAEGGRLLVTGEANINLRNALGNGEMIGLNWQQLQVKSPRLNLAFQQPYLFGSSFGVSTAFDLFKKDSSFLNLSFLLGLQYALPGGQSGKVFIQSLKTNLLVVDTQLVKSQKKLPEEIDVSSVNLGIDYAFNNTNYRFNPRKGTDIQVTVSAGSRRIRKNNAIIKLYDPSFSFASLYDSIKENSYQVRLRLQAAQYFQVSRTSTLKTALQAGLFQSPVIFRNELFQIGGYKILRGFDEESIFASRFMVATLEYRYLIGLNSFLFTFADAGYTANNSIRNQKNSFLGGGVGMAFETKGGIFNISYAAGKRNDASFNLRQSKIHLGYVNYF